MIALDTSILVHAHRRDSPDHEVAREAVGELIGSGAPWALPWSVVHEFLRVVDRGLWGQPTPMPVALDAVARLIESPGCAVLSEGRDHWPRLRSLIVAGRATGPIVYDARIVAVCQANGVRELWTADRDFGRFPGLRVRNPLVRA